MAENLLGQNFNVEKPNMIWVSDFTYVQTKQGWQYLAVVVDLFSRKVVGWSLKSRMTKQLVIEAMEMAIKNRKPEHGLIAHSDRGSQYCSNDYQKLLKKHKIICSMSKKGDPYDNACAETFCHTFKVERIHDEEFISYKDLKVSITEYIEVFYNHRRLHSYLGYMSPDEYEEVA